MDVVFLTKPGSADFFDLRYSMRSLVNVPHDRVWIIGSAPKWAQNIKFMSARDNKKSRYKNTLAKLIMACNNPAISDDFILMNDDFYILEPITEVKYYVLGSIENHMKHRKAQRSSLSDYARTIEAAYKLFPKGQDFETHTPMVINKKKLLDVVTKYGFPHLAQIRTLYGNHYGIVGEQMKNVPQYNRSTTLVDCKVQELQRLKINPGQIYLSSSDMVSRSRKFVDFIRKKFPAKGPYEK